MNKMLSVYGLTRLPFSKDLPASEMLDTEVLRAARERLQAALEGRASAVVTGDSGCGKTCLLRAMEEDLPQGRYRIHYVHNATVNRRDFYRHRHGTGTARHVCGAVRFHQPAHRGSRQSA
ncbi:MAG TPA: hypothetical protein VEM60_01455 [Candidatus Dormibacteraeota bacterium]|nr:hypothetical protein [Candidatus Dormibacteraeota bacterium]